MSNGLTPQLDKAEKEAFQAELDAIRDRVMSRLGFRELRYIRRLMRVQRFAELAGRASLFFGFNPVAWVSGVMLLALSKILENMEIGHNVMHGQYDWTNDPRLDGKSYEWDNVCPREQWRHAHNFMHHTYVNILGQDLDVGYGILRMTGAQKWRPVHLFQPLYTVVLAILFEWGVGFYDLLYKLKNTDVKLSDLVHRGRAESDEFLESSDNIWRKVGHQVLKDYVLFPLLSGPFFFYTLAGNVLANVIRNLWSFTIIFCGHFTKNVEMYSESVLENESKADWYIRQIEASSNIRGSRFFHIMAGNLSHQIEHHLFPDMPSVHLPEIAPEVSAICEKYGIRYNTGSLLRQFGQVSARIVRYAFPYGEGRAIPMPS